MTDSPAAPAPHQVTLYRNGSVYTAADPFATAMLVDGDTVAWVGSEQAATSIADSSMEVIDLHGALLAPGFVDSHIHLTETGIALDSLQLSGVRSARELLDAVAGFCASVPARAAPCWATAGTRPSGRIRTLPSQRRAGTRRRRAAGLPLPGRCALGARVLLAGGGRRARRNGRLRCGRPGQARRAHGRPACGAPAARRGAPRVPAAGPRGGGSQRLRGAGGNGGAAHRQHRGPAARRGLEHGAGRRPGDPALLGRAGRLGGPRPVHPGRAGRARAGAGGGPEHGRLDRVADRGAAGGLHRRAGGAGQPVPLGRGGGSPPRGVLAARASRQASTSSATPAWTPRWTHWTWRRRKSESRRSAPPATAWNTSSSPTRRPSAGWPSTP